ncbi:helix-turn-helix domain-containing protein [Pleomorphomonas koreensis]|uniref:helix-turn-helix domain-containing protein n=1 Tax=Pleomorphomonas koreensis TaxID=257440 RepID=UPI00047D2FB8|nr:helix-turn-helix domain-containing protein [Pleomorphomonas koreensis]
MDDDFADMLREENDRLREQIAFLERALGLEFMPPVEWRLTPSEARVFGALCTRELMTRDVAMAVLYRDLAKEEAYEKIVDVYICKMRKKLRPFGIEILNRWGVGYELTPESRAIIAERLEAHHG